MINNPVNIDSNMNIFIFSKLINTISVATKDKNNEIKIHQYAKDYLEKIQNYE